MNRKSSRVFPFAFSLLSLYGIGLAFSQIQSGSSARVFSQSETNVPASLPAGLPRPWEGGMGISPFSSVNLRTGNVVTSVSLFQVNPLGPALGFSLIHNSGIANAVVTPRGSGFSLGAGWSVSYDSFIIADANQATLMASDGSHQVYRRSENRYEAPAANFSRLERVADGSWTLTHPSQNQELFDVQGRLVGVKDSSGNLLSIVRDAQGRFESIRSAADSLTPHRVQFFYDLNSGRLQSFQDVMKRNWSFHYDGQGRLSQIDYPSDEMIPESSVRFSYDNRNRILGATSRDNRHWVYRYSGPRLESATQPGSFIQSFSFGNPADEGLTETVYTDPRGFSWKARYDASGNLRETINPLNKKNALTYDVNHNVVQVRDTLNRNWITTYGPIGNVTSFTSPLAGQRWILDWERIGAADSNFYRMTKATNPLGNSFQYIYDNDSVNPAQPSGWIEPEDMDGNSALTTLSYYDEKTPNARGKLRNIIDANGVIRHFSWDSYGFFAQYEEGIVGERALPTNPTLIWVSSNPSGAPDSAGTDSGSGNAYYDIQGDALGDSCVAAPLRGATPQRLGNLPSPLIDAQGLCSLDNRYDVVGRPLEINRCAGPEGELRSYHFSYDSLGRMRTARTDQEEGAFSSQFENLEFNEVGQVLRSKGPDGRITQCRYDALGRIERISRGNSFVQLSYDAGGRLQSKSLGNGTRVIYSYDEIDRLKQIRHEDFFGQTISQLNYVWNLDNSLASRIESRGQEVLQNQYAYDARQRLIREWQARLETNKPAVLRYNYAYHYDPVGNRSSKEELVSGLRTQYFYDTQEENRDPQFPTNNNRLIRYEEYQGFTLQRTVNYTYYKTGDVSNITVKDESDPWERDLAFYYNKDGALWRVLQDQWQRDSEGKFFAYQKESAREFRYDSPRARYFAADLDPEKFESLGNAHWVEYEGVSPYREFDRSADGQMQEKKRYFGHVVEEDSQTGESQYMHGDLMSNTVALSNDQGQQEAKLEYTAFGEPIGEVCPAENSPECPTRYRYGGGAGYETGLLSLAGAPGTASIEILHVGQRWLDPSLGRFLQRDPFAARNAGNAYLYVNACPMTSNDPTGLATSMTGLVIENLAIEKWFYYGTQSSRGLSAVELFYTASQSPITEAALQRAVVGYGASDAALLSTAEGTETYIAQFVRYMAARGQSLVLSQTPGVFSPVTVVVEGTGSGAIIAAEGSGAAAAGSIAAAGVGLTVGACVATAVVFGAAGYAISEYTPVGDIVAEWLTPLFY